MLPFTLAQPELLALLILLPLLVALALYSGRRRRNRLQRFGRPEALALLTSLKPNRRARARLCLLGAVLFLIVSLAGPRWGKGESGVVIGRDVMIALDFSKSMLAEDMQDPDGHGVKPRWIAARAGIKNLVESIRQRGGHRIGLVVFAAKPWVVCPLTADYDHFLMRLDEYAPTAPPPEMIPSKGEQFPSGTRIGAGIAEAVRWHDPRFPGSQDVIIISDGDDPASDAENEIEKGIRAALDAQIPVHVVGVGDPNDETTVTWKWSDTEEERFATGLKEAPLEEIARQTHGEYLSAQREVPKLAEFFRSRIEPRPSRDLPDDALPQPRERYLWFLLMAFVILVLAWWIEP